MITDAIRRARVISAWEQRYRTGALPDEDNHPDLMATASGRSPAMPIVDRLELWIAAHWTDEVQA